MEWRESSSWVQVETFAPIDAALTTIGTWQLVPDAIQSHPSHNPGWGPPGFGVACSFDDTPPLGQDARRLLHATSVPASWSFQREPTALGFAADAVFAVTQPVSASDVAVPARMRTGLPGTPAELG